MRPTNAESNNNFSTAHIQCRKARKLMSPYVDGMAEREESELLESHLESCESCRIELQSYVSMRSLVARVEPAGPPEDLALETRVRLSRARSIREAGRFDRIEALLMNVLKPVAIPAVAGVALTVLCFGVMFGHLAMNFRAENVDSSTSAQEQPVRTTDQTLLSSPRGALKDTGSDSGEPVSVQASVGVEGRVYGITIIGGAQSPAVKRWINDLLYPAHFAPATRLGKPVNSTIILSFVNVRS